MKARERYNGLQKVYADAELQAASHLISSSSGERDAVVELETRQAELVYQAQTHRGTGRLLQQRHRVLHGHAHLPWHERADVEEGMCTQWLAFPSWQGRHRRETDRPIGRAA